MRRDEFRGRLTKANGGVSGESLPYGVFSKRDVMLWWLRLVIGPIMSSTVELYKRNRSSMLGVLLDGQESVFKKATPQGQETA